jgi:Cu-processing system permease protein
VSTALKILRYQLEDVRRSRGVLVYAVVLFALTEALLRFGGGGPRAVLSLMSVVLLGVPLVSLLFGTTYLYGARDFIELLLAQPVRRRVLWRGLYLGLALPLAAGFALAVALPFAWHPAPDEQLLRPLATLVGTGVLLTFTFTGLAFLISIAVDDRARGLGLAMMAWLACTLVYDGVLLLVITTLGDYPLELPLLGLTLLNPVDLGRVLLLLQFDTAALMGYTGAVFERFFGSAQGVLVSASALALWVAVPLLAARRKFRVKDF